jgi:hypothetical protein
VELRLTDWIKMNDGSAALRRAQPLSPQGVGFVLGHGVSAWANWDRIQVRTEQNEVLLDYTTQGHLLHSGLEFINNRYLVVPIGTGIMVAAFKVYDFLSRQWTFEIEGNQVEIGFCGAHPNAPIIAVTEDDGLGLWDLREGRRISLVSISGEPNVAAFGGPGSMIAIATWEHIIMIDEGREIMSVRVCEGDVAALAWNISRSFLLCADCPGNLMQIDPKALHVTHLICQVSGGIKKIRISPDGRTAIAIGRKGQAMIVDCENGGTTGQEDIFDAAFSPTDANCILIAGSVGMRRLEISRLGA